MKFGLDHEVKRPLARPRHGWDNNTRLDLMENELKL
jgi:hypothetical protein